MTHSFGDMVKGALGILATAHAPKAAGHGGGHDHATDHGDGGGKQAAEADVEVEMGEMYVKADKTKIEAGKATFAVTNAGQTTHGMALALVPVEESGGMLDEQALIGKGAELAPGDSDTISADLEAGKYELVCFIPGHYAAGQKLAFEVTP